MNHEPKNVPSVKKNESGCHIVSPDDNESLREIVPERWNESLE